jgi:hypothetical protein
MPDGGPHFRVGDKVRMVTPGIHTGKRGIVVEITEPGPGDGVQRYRVRFFDSSSGVFFGFELESPDKTYS